MSEDRKLTYTVEVNSGGAKESIESLAKDVEGLRKSIGDIKSQKISVDDSGLKASVGEIRKELDGMKSSLNEISKGNLRITDANLSKDIEAGAKGIEGIQAATKGASAALQTYNEKLRITEKAIDNLSQLIRNGISTKIEVLGIEYTMSQLRALESEFAGMKQQLKGGSLASQEKAYLDKLTEAQKNYDKVVESSNRQRERGFKLSQSAWKQQIADIEEARKALEAFGKDADFSKKSLLTERNWTDYLGNIDKDGAQGKYVRGNIEAMHQSIEARTSAIARNEKRIADEAERAAKAAEKQAAAEENEIKRLTSQLNELNRAYEIAEAAGKRFSLAQYDKNRRGADEIVSRLRQLQQPAQSSYTHTTEEYNNILKAEQAQRQLNSLSTQYQAMIDRINVGISKGRSLTEAEYDILKRKTSELEKQMELLQSQNNLQTDLPSNPLQSDERFNTFANYQRAIEEMNAKYNSSMNPALRSYSEQISRAQMACEALYQTYRKDPTGQNLANFAAMRNSLVGLEKEYGRYQRSIESAGSRLDEFARKAKSHFTWIASGAMIGAAATIPAAGIDTITKLDQQMANIRQVIPQIEANPLDAGTEAFAEQQNKMNQAMTDFINIASTYSGDVSEVMDAARSIGRMYGQGEDGLKNTEIFTAQAAKMSIADAFSMADATKGLEAAMSQWNLQTNDSNNLMTNSQYILDVWTRTAHSGAASAQDIGEAIENAGSAAAQAGVSFDFFNSLVETGVRVTGRSGNEIGQSIKSMMVSMQSAKAQKALEDWGIKTKEIGEDGVERVRSMEDIILDTSLMVSTTTKDTQQLMTTLAGGRYQYSKVSAILKDYKELLRMQGVLNDGKTQGFADKQVKVQMDTIENKLKKLKADATNLLADIGKDGGIETLKWMVKTIDNLVVGIRKLNQEAANGGSNILSKTLAIGKALTAAYVTLKIALPALARFLGSLKSQGMWNGTKREMPIFKDTWKRNYEKGAVITTGASSSTVAGTANSAAEKANTGATTANTAAKNANAVANTKDTTAIVSNTNAEKANTAAQTAGTAASTRGAAAAKAEAAADTAATAAKTRDAAAARAEASADSAAAAAKTRDAAASRNDAGARNTDAAAAQRERAAVACEKAMTDADTNSQNRNAASQRADATARNINSAAAAKQKTSSAGVIASMGKEAQAAKKVETATKGATTASKGMSALSGVMGAVASRFGTIGTKVAGVVGSLGRLASVGRVAGAAFGILRGAVAAFGGPAGLAASIAATLALSLIDDATSAGEAANAAQDAADDFDEFCATQRESYELADRQGEAAEKLANQYNDLVDKINSGELSTEEAAKAQEHLGEIEQTVGEIVGEEAVKFDENKKMDIAAIRKVTAANKQHVMDYIEDKRQELLTLKSQVLADAEATKSSGHNTAERLRHLRSEIEGCKNTAAGWWALNRVIAQVEMAAGNALRSIAQDLNKAADNFGKGNSFTDWLRDRGESIIGLDNIRAAANAVSNLGEAMIADGMMSLRKSQALMHNLGTSIFLRVTSKTLIIISQSKARLAAVVATTMAREVKVIPRVAAVAVMSRKRRRRKRKNQRR